jgi:pSer/pThr/pTyr-binding forkhead associated (FHA) protein
MTPLCPPTQENPPATGTWVVILHPSRPAQHLTLRSGMVFGRGPGADVTLEDPSVSERHCLVTGGVRQGWTLVDLNSRNGTWTDEHRLREPHVLRPGETIRLGRHSALTFVPASTDVPPGERHV